MNKNKFKCLIFILGLIIPLFIEKFIYPNEGISIDRYIIFMLLFEFCLAHLVFDIKKMWDYIFKYRYLIGIVLFSYIVINGYHSSSIGLYNGVVEPNVSIEKGTPLIGVDRAIRSDEWVVTSMHILSQNTKANGFSNYNNSMMGTGSLVDFYPKLPTKNLSILTTPQFLGFCFLPIEQAYSFYSYFLIFFTFFASFEFLMLITRKNKMWSLTGALLITFAPAVQWWDQQIIIPAGMTAVLLIDKYLKENNRWMKLLLSILVGWMGAIYFMSFYPAFMIPYFYFYFGIFIWLLYINKGKYKVTDILFLMFIIALTMITLILPAYLNSKDIFEIMNNTVYPGARFSTGGYGFEKLFNYIISIFLPFVNFSNASEAAQFISFYPIPIIMGIKYIYDNFKKKKMDLLLIVLVAVSIILSIWNYIEMPKIIAKLSLLYMSTPERCQLIVGFVCTILLIYCMANYVQKDTKDKYYKIVLGVVIALLAIYINKTFYGAEISTKIIIVSIILFSILNSAIVLNVTKINKYLAIILAFIALGSGLTVHPISKGLGVIYDKPVSKEIQKISNKNSDSLWISVSDSILFSNYALANGAKMLNSTNFYPNLELWSIVDEDNIYSDTWNRYSHMIVSLTIDNTSVELIQPDMIKLNLNVDKMCDLNIEYILSNKHDLNDFSDSVIDINNIYYNDNLFIYKNNCK